MPPRSRGREWVTRSITLMIAPRVFRGSPCEGSILDRAPDPSRRPRYHRAMALFPKLEVAIDQGLVLIAEAIALVRLANVVLAQLQPTVAELPEIARGARRVIDALQVGQTRDAGS